MSNIINRNWRKLAVVGALGLMAATQASADAFISQTRSGNQIVPFGAAASLVALQPGVFRTPLFANAANQRFIVSYTAECAVAAAAGNFSTWMHLDVRAVNNATGAVFTLAPSVGTLDAFCTSNGSAANDGWTMAAINAVGGIGMPAGVYYVEVRARPSAAGGSGHLGDSSLIVWR